jgi:hypothetical protein
MGEAVTGDVAIGSAAFNGFEPAIALLPGEGQQETLAMGKPLRVTLLGAEFLARGIGHPSAFDNSPQPPMKVEPQVSFQEIALAGSTALVAIVSLKAPGCRR